MNSLRKHIQQVVIVSMASLVVLGSIMALFPGRAFAAPQKYSDMTVMDQAITFTSTRAVLSADCELRSIINADQLRAGEWLSGTTNVGLHVDPDDGKVSCQNENLWFSKLLATAGYSGNLVDAADGIYTQNGSNYRLTNNGETVLRQLIGNAIYGGAIPGRASDAVTYAALWTAFNAQNGCNATQGTDGSESAQINVYDEGTKTVSPVSYSFSSNNTRVGYNLSANVGATISCNEIAGKLSNATLANAVKTYVDTTGNGFSSTSTGTAGEDPNLKCGLSNPLNWLLCPIILGINAFISYVDNTIISLLEVDQKKIFKYQADSEGPAENSAIGYREAWETFRSLAVGILFVAALVMIIAQALGFEILDAYAIKKLFPRLIVAIIGIALSWEIMEFFVVLTNDLGLGIRQLIYYPFRDMEGMDGFGTGAALAVYFLSGAAFLALGPMGLLSFALTAALALIVAFLVLVIRQLVIVVLILFAPIAIACYILPNTDGVWKLWYESFTKAMMMFPIIVAFLAVGRVFAITAWGGSVTAGAPTAVNQLIGFAAYFLPYFLIPFTFRFAGGAMRTLGGLTNDRSRGGFDRLKKFRAGTTATRAQKMKDGHLFRPNTALGRKFNATSSTIASLPSAGFNPKAMRSRFTSAQAEQTYNQAEEIRTKNSAFAVGSQDDRILRVAGKAEGRADIRRRLMAEGITNPAELDTAVGNVEKMQSSGSREAVRAAIAIQRFATGTGYNDENGQFDYKDAMDTIRDASGGDRALAGRLLGTAKGVSAQAQQTAFGGASYGALSKGLDQSFDPRQSVNGDAIALAAFEGNDAVTVARARPPHVAAMTKAVTERITALQAGATPRMDGELGRLTAQLDNFRESATMYAAPDRQVTINIEGSASSPARSNLAEQYSTYVKQVNDYRSGSGPAPSQPDANLREFMNYRNARAGDPNDPRRQEPEK